MDTIGNFGISPIDRHAEIRHDVVKIESVQQSDASRFICWYQGRILIPGSRELFFTLAELKAFNILPHEPIFLGKEQTLYFFALQLDMLPPLFKENELINLRAAALLADEFELGLLFHGQGLINWHHSHHYCAKCGSKTQVSNAGHSRRCINQDCLREHFPRLDPAVIFSIVNRSGPDERLLLARQAVWDEGRYSVIAGFVEPGETLEHAVRREAFEEVGLKLDSVKYHASQPWPFPSSIMLGFETVTNEEEITLIDKEIEHAMWLTVDEIKTKVESGELKLPYSVSISWHLVNRWFESQSGMSLSELNAPK